MKKTGKVKLVYLLALGLIVSMVGCINVNDANVPVTDYRSLVKFVNLANTGSSMAVAVDGNSVATVNYGAASDTINLPSGTRLFKFTYGSAFDTLRTALKSQYAYIAYAVSDPSVGVNKASYYFFADRYIFSTGGVKDSVLVSFVNMSPDTAGNISGGVNFIVTIGTKDSTVATGVLLGKQTANVKVAASANPKYTITDANGSTLTGMDHVSLNGQALGRYKVVLYGSGANLKTVVLKVN
ncbi:MAG: hypothetical protein ACP5US_00530 [Candidatus Kryptoniota bacterium]